MIYRIFRQISPPFFEFLVVKSLERGLYDEYKTKTVFFRNQNFCMTLDDVAFDFLFEEDSELDEMTDDDSNFSPWELKVEFIPRKFIHFTLNFFLVFSI